MPLHLSVSFPTRRLVALILGLSGVLLLKASASDVWMADLPLQSPTPFSHFSEPPRQNYTPDGLGYLEFSLLPPSQDQDLLVTILFEEDGKSGPAVIWKSSTTGTQVTLSENLAEGVFGLNQRTILIPADLTASPGQLIIQSPQGIIRRVRLDWAFPRLITAAADQRPVAFLSSDRLLLSTELDGRLPLSPPDTWFGDIIEASLQEEPTALADAIEFAPTLDASVSQVLLSVRVLGLPLNEEISVWLNGSPVGHLRPFLPSLTDAGYVRNHDGTILYAGWRTALLALPAGQLHLGENSLIFGAAGDKVFIKDAALQLRPVPSPSVAP